MEYKSGVYDFKYSEFHHKLDKPSFIYELDIYSQHISTITITFYNHKTHIARISKSFRNETHNFKLEGILLNQIKNIICDEIYCKIGHTYYFEMYGDIKCKSSYQLGVGNGQPQSK